MEEVIIKLTKDEALVLFEFLSRYSDEGKLSIEDQSEQRALWNLTCILEQVLVEPFSENYWSDIISAARERLRDKE